VLTIDGIDVDITGASGLLDVRSAGPRFKFVDAVDAALASDPPVVIVCTQAQRARGGLSNKFVRKHFTRRPANDDDPGESVAVYATSSARNPTTGVESVTISGHPTVSSIKVRVILPSETVGRRDA
jgi:hypothetical protein